MAVKGVLQALKRGSNLNDLAARVKLVPFPNLPEGEFFSRL
jgi:hypothetical protein